MQRASDYASLAVGRPIDEYRAIHQRPESYTGRTGWPETWVELPNGNREYVAPIRGCVVRWEVNSKGTIIGYRLFGERCD
jgi:hypothetical protein